LHPLYAKGEWKGQGRQGLLNQVRYDLKGKPLADYPTNNLFSAPKLPSGGIPWMVPKSDFFTSESLNPEWCFLGYTLSNKSSLTERHGWLRLTPKSPDKANTVLKNDGEHNYSIITRLDFNATKTSDEAGLLIMRGDEKMFVKLVSSLSADSKKVIVFSFENTKYDVLNTFGGTLWLKMVRVNHEISGYCSSNGVNWIQIGKAFDISQIDSYSDYSSFTGTRQGLYVKGNNDAWFDLYIYRDAYTPILAECPANYYGTTVSTKKDGISSLDNIHDNDWALYAGVEFGNDEYQKSPDSLEITASCNSTGGVVEVWLDSLDSSNKIAECAISNTGSLDSFKTFAAKITQNVTGRHDVYLRFKGTGADKLYMLQWFSFISHSAAARN
jgi:hypothetical protein